MTGHGPRHRLPKTIAVIHADYCTGCEACIEVCPVDCIELIEREPGVKGVHSWCEIDLQRCIGCRLCLELPRKRTDDYQLLVCPWDAIEMVPLERLPEAVADLGGPPEYARQQRRRMVETARQLVELKHAQAENGGESNF